MDTSAQWPQQDMSKPMEEMTTIPSSVLLDQRNNNKAAALTRAPHKDRGGFSCPRCNSSNTKFCYYNNYSLSQPRFFCKTCRRYWTQGGSLRNIPVGGASRKNNNKALNINMITRTSASSSSSSAPPPTPPPNNHNTDQAQQQNPSRKDEDLGYKSFADMIQLPTTFHQMPNYNNYAIMPVYGSLLPEALINNKSSSSSSLNFSLDYGSDYHNHSNSGDHNNNKSLFPFEDLKQQQDRDNDIHQTGDGFWNGVNLGSGGSW